MNISSSLLRTCGLIPALVLLFHATMFSQDNRGHPKQEFGLEKATNLGKTINASSGQYAPTISADGRTLIFESNLLGEGLWKLYIAHRTDSGWTTPALLDNVNSNTQGDFDGGSFLTYDQNYLLFSSDRSGGLGGIDIWISERQGEEWTEPKNIGAPVNSSGYDGFASLSSDGKTIYFIRDAEDNETCVKTNSFDLYYSIKKNDKWMEPRKLPYPINSKYCEGHPIILSDGKTLIFSSTRPGGFGGYDLYKSERRSDGSWSEPINLGSFINTSNDDEIVSVPASGDIMFYSSGEQDHADLYSIPIPVGVRSSTVITVAGTVMDATTNKPLSAEITIIDVEANGEPAHISSNQTDGKYIVILNKGKIYDVSVTADGYTFLSTQFDLKELKAFKEYIRDIRLDPIETGSKMVLNNIYFDVDNDSLLDISKYELQRAIKLLRDNRSMIVEIAGHTDSTGTKEHNLDLSLRRARSVVRYFVNNGIEKKRLTGKGYGESLPIADNATDEGRQQNRRVEFRIIYVGKVKK